MIIYDKDKRILFVPENDDAVILEWKDIYQKGFRDGYEEGYDDAYADNYQSGYTDGYASGIVSCHVDASSITLVVASVIVGEGQADVVVEPADADVELVFTSSDPSLATITNYGYIDVLDDGEVTFCVEDLETGLKDCKTVSVEKPVEPYFRIIPEGNILFERSGGTINLIIDTNMDIPWRLEISGDQGYSCTASTLSGTGYSEVVLTTTDVGCGSSFYPARGFYENPDGVGQFQYDLKIYTGSTIYENKLVLQKAWFWGVPVISTSILNQPEYYPATGGTYTLTVKSNYGPTTYPTVANFDRMLGTAVYSGSTAQGFDWTHYYTYTVPANTGSTITDNYGGVTQRMTDSPCDDNWEYENYYIESQDGGATPPTPARYLTISPLEDGSIIAKQPMELSRDGGNTWESADVDDEISLEEGEDVMFRGELTGTTYCFGPATSLTRFDVFGNIASMQYGSGFTGQTTMLGSIKSVFRETGVVDASNLYLPDPGFTDQYQEMFRGCSNLTTAPELPATALTQSCYASMFRGCTSLETAPDLPATTLARACYANLFDGCTSLTTTPELPVTSLTDYCYYYMFQNCSSLTTAPELPAETLERECYESMFRGCTSLNYIKCLATDISAVWSTLTWVQNVSPSGTFVKNPAMNDWTTGVNGIPSGWVGQEI